jgi:hypothetical protein
MIKRHLICLVLLAANLSRVEGAHRPRPVEEYFSTTPPTNQWLSSPQLIEAMIQDRNPDWMSLPQETKRLRLQALKIELREAKRERRIDPYLSQWTDAILSAIQSESESRLTVFMGIDPLLYLEKREKLKLQTDINPSSLPEFYESALAIFPPKSWWKRYHRKVPKVGALSLPSYVLSQYFPLQQRELAEIFSEFKSGFTSGSGEILLHSGEDTFTYPLSLRERGRVACHALTRNLSRTTLLPESYLYGRYPAPGDALAAAWLEGVISTSEAETYSRVPCFDERKMKSTENIGKIQTWVSPIFLLTPSLNAITLSIFQVRSIIELFRKEKKESGDEKLLVH